MEKPGIKPVERLAELKKIAPGEKPSREETLLKLRGIKQSAQRDHMAELSKLAAKSDAEKPRSGAFAKLKNIGKGIISEETTIFNSLSKKIGKVV